VSDDAVYRYCAASERGDMDALMSTLAPGVELDSPISGHTTFRGRDDVGFLLVTVYSTLRDLRWTGQVVGDGDLRMVIAEARVGPFGLTDAMAFDLDQEGRISRIRPHLRPWLALTALAVALVPRMMLRHPGALWRARFG
jgi:hypothetical protein